MNIHFANNPFIDSLLQIIFLWVLCFYFWKSVISTIGNIITIIKRKREG